MPYLSGETIGYVSTKFGAGYEYVKKDRPTLFVKRSSQRIEELFLNTPRRVSRLEPHYYIAAKDITIIGLPHEGRFPFRLTSETASLRLIGVSFKVDTWSRKIDYAEIFANRSVDFWDTRHAVSRAKDEVFVHLLYVQKARERSLSLSDYLNKFKEKTVLLLGDYEEDGMKRLGIIKDALLELGYEPILLKEIPEHLDYSLQQKLIVYGSVARFVMIDDSSRGGHLAELRDVENSKWVAVILRLAGSESSYTVRGSSVTSKVIKEYSYSSETLMNVLEAATKWAEEKVKELRRSWQDEYPWRSEGKPDSSDR